MGSLADKVSRATTSLLILLHYREREEKEEYVFSLSRLWLAVLNSKGLALSSPPLCFGNLEAKYLHFSDVSVNSLESLHLSTPTTLFSLSHSFGRLLSSSSRPSWPLFQTDRWACVVWSMVDRLSTSKISQPWADAIAACDPSCSKAWNLLFTYLVTWEWEISCPFLQAVSSQITIISIIAVPAYKAI